MKSFLKSALLLSALLIPVSLTTTPLRAAEHRYHDDARNDDHSWNNHEDRAYRIWAKENHRRYTKFNKLRREDQEAYWAWRHNHDDATLKINIR